MVMHGYAGLYVALNGTKHDHNGDTLLYTLIELSELMFLPPGQYFFIPKSLLSPPTSESIQKHQVREQVSERASA